MIREGRETADPQGTDLLLEPIAIRRQAEERGPIGPEIGRSQPRDPTFAVGGVGHFARITQCLFVHVQQDAADRGPNGAEVFGALHETDGGAGRIHDLQRFRRDLRDPACNGGVDAGDADRDVAGIRAAPHQPLGIVEEVVRELATFDLHGLRAISIRMLKSSPWGDCQDP